MFKRQEVLALVIDVSLKQRIAHVSAADKESLLDEIARFCTLAERIYSVVKTPLVPPYFFRCRGFYCVLEWAEYIIKTPGVKYRVVDLEKTIGGKRAYFTLVYEEERIAYIVVWRREPQWFHDYDRIWLSRPV